MSNSNLNDQNGLQAQQDVLERYYTELFAKAEFSPTLEDGVHHLNAFLYDPDNKEQVYDVLRVCMAQMVVALDEEEFLILDSKLEQNFKIMMAAVYMSLKAQTAEITHQLAN